MSDDSRMINYCCGSVKAAPSKARWLEENVWCEKLKYSNFTLPRPNASTSGATTLQEGVLRICVVSDTHGEHSRLGVLPASDIFIHAGDILFKSRKMTESTAKRALNEFNSWLGRQKATYKIVIGGNHDQVLLGSYGENGVDMPDDCASHIATVQSSILTNAIYLCNSSVKLYNDSFTVVGSPMSVGQGSNNKTFQTYRFQTISKTYIESVAASGAGVDLLITHGPCFEFAEQLKPSVAHVYGHIHEDYGVKQIFYKNVIPKQTAVETEAGKDPPEERPMEGNGTAPIEAAVPTYRSWFRIAASFMNVDFQPKQLPFLVDIPLPRTIGAVDTESDKLSSSS